MDNPTLPVSQCFSHLSAKPFSGNAEPQQKAAKYALVHNFLRKLYCGSKKWRWLNQWMISNPPQTPLPTLNTKSGQTWYWSSLVWPNLVLAKRGLANLGKTSWPNFAWSKLVTPVRTTRSIAPWRYTVSRHDVSATSGPKRFQWVKMNLDTRAAVNTFPLNFSPEGTEDGRFHQAVGGGWISNDGTWLCQGYDENGFPKCLSE